MILKNERKYIYIILLITVVITAFFQFKDKTEQTSIPVLNESCMLEYGKSECIDGKIYTPFYNPNNVSINTVKLFIPKSNGVDIYNVMEPLKSEESEALTTADCSNIENFSNRLSMNLIIITSCFLSSILYRLHTFFL